MQPRRPLPRHQILFVVVLALLAALTAGLWFADPAHRPTGGSRIDWPGSAATKP